MCYVDREVVVGLDLAAVQAVSTQQHHLVRVYPERIVVIVRLLEDEFCFCFWL